MVKKVVYNKYSEKEKQSAFILYLSKGNLREVGRILNIDYNLLYKWKYSPWWKKQYQELELGNKIKFGSKISNILDKSVDKLDDILENGNYYFNFKTKTVERKPLTAKEVAEVLKTAVQAQDLNDKAREAIEQRDSQEAAQEALKQRLDNLAKMLAGTKANKPEPVVIEAEFTEVPANAV